MNRRGLQAKLHIAKKDLGLDDDAYRLVLAMVTGKQSSKDMSDNEVAKVVEHFKRMGWEPKKKSARSDNPAVRKVWAIWGDLGRLGALRSPGKAGLRAFCKNLVSVEDPEWMSPEQLSKVIESLKIWQRREGAKNHE